MTVASNGTTTTDATTTGTTTTTGANRAATHGTTANMILAPAVRPVLWRRGLAGGAVAAVVVCGAVAAAEAAGIAMEVGGKAIPLLGFAQFTLIGALLGIGLARAVARRAQRPRAGFLVLTAVLTAVSIVPDVLVDATIATKVVLAATHLIAAAIVVPALASRLTD